MLLQMAFFFFNDWVELHYNVYHVFTHSSDDWHLRCFCELVIIDIAAMNTGENASFSVIACLDICPGVGLLDHTITIFNFWRNFHTVLLLSSISLYCSLRKAFLSLLAIIWNSAFKWVYLSFSPLPFFTNILGHFQLE